MGTFCSAKVCSSAIFETSFSYDKDIWIAPTDYYMHFYACPGSETLRSKMFMLGMDIGWGGVGVQHHGVTLI